MSFKFELNRILCDAVTNVAGHCTARAEYIDRLPEYRIERMNHIGEICAEWLPETRLIDKGPSVGGDVQMGLLEAAERAASETSEHRPLPEAPSPLPGL